MSVCIESACVCATKNLRESGRQKTKKAKPQEGGLCEDTHRQILPTLGTSSSSVVVLVCWYSCSVGDSCVGNLLVRWNGGNHV